MYVHLESILYGDINESYECVTRKCPLQGYKCAIKSIFYNYTLIQVNQWGKLVYISEKCIFYKHV